MPQLGLGLSTLPLKRLTFTDDSFIRPAVDPEKGWYSSKTDKYYPSIEAALSDSDGRLLFSEPESDTMKVSYR